MDKSLDLTGFAIAFAGFVLAGAWREFHHFKREIQKWQAKIDTALFGVTGGNGLNGISKDHETRIRQLENNCQAHHG